MARRAVGLPILLARLVPSAVAGAFAIVQAKA